LTLDSAARYSPSATGAGPSRRDSGYGSSSTASPTFPVVDIFTPPPPLPLPLAGLVSVGPLTAPLPSVSQSPGWFDQPYRNPPNATFARHPPGLARPATTAQSKNNIYFVFEGFNVRH